MKTAIIVPCYNEELRFIAFVREHAHIDFMFVDDGSTDATRLKLQELCASVPARMQLLAFDANQGKAETVRQGVISALEAGYGLIGYWDSDLSTPLDAIPRFIGLFDNQRIQLVMGSRIKLLGRRIERRALRHYIGRAFATFASIVLGLGVYDTQCGAKLFRSTEALRTVFSRPFSSRWVFDVEVLARLLALEKKGKLPADTVTNGVIEYPLEEWTDIPGSKIRFVDAVRVPFDLLRIYWHLRHSEE
jgi:dolichyl-phosphate beta-glucosyltransferase